MSVRSINRIAWMWDEALHALEQAERRQRQFFGLAGARAAVPVWEPPADVFESDTEVFVSIALPGVPAQAVSVHVAASGLVVTAERVPSGALERVRVHRMEIPHGHFERRIELAPGRYAVLERHMADGILTLRLAKE
jgi:HSP20 family molecular chaperone IbpA